MIVIEEGVKPTFGGHEKFVFRHGWLKKGVDAVQDTPEIFVQDDAFVTLGVGKNMVRSIRHWCLSAGLLKEVKDNQKARPSLQISELGKNLVLDNGWDPYFEDAGTLWLIHWQIISNQVRSLVWNIAFTSFPVFEFSKKQLVDHTLKAFDHAHIRTTIGTIEREVDCCLRTYVPSRIARQDGLEDGLDCPLAELDLIRFFSVDNIYQFNVGPKLSLPVAIFSYALIQYLRKVAHTRRTITVDECLYNAGSPGQAFKLDENSVIEYLDELEKLTKGKIRLMETAGLRQIYFEFQLVEPFRKTELDLLSHYYGR